MRQIIIDTETTGLDPKLGHRVIEVAALEVANRRATGRTVHLRLDPERDIDIGATEVHGMTWDDLKGKPRFVDVAAEFVAFATGAEWIIHNAPFDIGFLDAELARVSLPACADIHAGVVDTLALAREMFPGKRNSLDALCERFGVDNAHRSVHGALLDAQLLADVWLAMTRGQETLDIVMSGGDAPAMALAASPLRASLIVVRASAEELAEHAAMCERIERESKGRCLWMRIPIAA